MSGGPSRIHYFLHGVEAPYSLAKEKACIPTLARLKKQPMKFTEWFEASGKSRSDVARELEVVPATITNLLNGSQAWLSRDLAEKIAKITDGQVTPNDFLQGAA
jgi:hypothetical protein